MPRSDAVWMKLTKDQAVISTGVLRTRGGFRVVRDMIPVWDNIVHGCDDASVLHQPTFILK